MMKYNKSGLTEILIQWFLPLVFLAIGIYFFHGNMFRDGMNYIHGDFGDSRLISLLLEHSYQVIFRIDTAISYWSPYWIYYPAKNGLAYSDVMSGAVFLYAPWRLLGISALTSYQLWFLSTSLVNFGAFLLLARYLGFSSLGATVGGYVACFSMTNISYANHPQMLSHYFILLTSYFLLRLFDSNHRSTRLRFAAAAGLCYAFQFWLAFYPAWFFTFIAGLMGLYLLVAYRLTIRRQWKSYIGPALTFVVLAGLLIYPLIRRYLIIKNLIGPRGWQEVNFYLPTWQAYLLPTAESSVYKTLFNRFSPGITSVSELCLFSGFVVLSVPLLFFLCRCFDRVPSRQRLLMGAVTFALLTTMVLSVRWGLDLTSHSLWRKVFYSVPGANAIRAVGRVSLILHLLSAVLLAYVLTFLQRRLKFGGIIGVVLAGIIVVENTVNHQYLFSIKEHQARLDSLAATLPKDWEACAVFHRSYRQDSFPNREIDVMLISQQTHIPTSNGYSGSMPPMYWDADIYRSLSIEKIVDWFNMNNQPIEQKKICFLP